MSAARALAAWMALWSASCAGAPSTGTIAAVEPALIGRAAFPAFPARIQTSDVRVEARFVVDHALLFGADLIADEAVVPIEVRIESLSRTVELCFDTVRLVLADGTTLRSVRGSTLRVASAFTENAVRSLEHAPGPVDGVRRFFYFALEPASDFHVRGSEVTRRVKSNSRRLELADGLVAFEVECDGAIRPLRVGLRVEASR